MTILRRASGASWAAILVLGLGAASPAFGQFDMTPYRPYTAGYRASSYPSELSSTGDAATTSGYFGPRPYYRQPSFEARVAQELDAADLYADDGSASRVARTPAETEEASLAESQRLRDSYYFKAITETDPKRKAALMELSRREDRKLERGLSATRSRPAARAKAPTPAPAASSRPAAARPAATTRPATPRAATPAVRTPAASPTASATPAPAPAAPAR